MIVCDFPTICDGYVVRWSHTEADANRSRWFISASREGVVVHEQCFEAESVRPVATEVHELIRRWYRQGGRGDKTWVSYLTHLSPFMGDVRPLASA